jgi:hypothetical protein
MASSSATSQISSPQAEAGATSKAPRSGGRDSMGLLQQLVDQATGFNLFAVPDQRSSTNAAGKQEFSASENLHRFQVVLKAPTSRGVQAANIVGEVVGRLTLRWIVIPDNYYARPDRQPPAVRLDPAVSQRFVMQEMTLSFGDGSDGFRSFGTGRTFPMLVGLRPRIVVSAVANVTEGFGRFRHHDGNLTICGDLMPNGFCGNILVRFQDPAFDLRTSGSLPKIQPQPDPDPQTTYFLWVGQKGEEQPGYENHFSLGPDGQVRGMDITTQEKILHLDFAVPGGFQAKSFTTEKKIVGLEIGFGRGSIPDAPPTGTPLSPYMFEGVAQYTFFDNKGTSVGSLLTNVIEGRRFDMRLPGAPNEVAWRFGFFGPIIYGTGCFEGVEGMFYGASGSIFNPPPGAHIVTHFYMARMNDPEGKFRAAVASGGWSGTTVEESTAKTRTE